MQITPEYCRLMARYNQWQNKGLMALVGKLSDADLRADRGAFFKSILGTLNHLLWADTIWLSRLTGQPPPAVGIADSVTFASDKAEWARLRFLMDGRLREWARGLDAVDLVGHLHWHSGALGRDISNPIAICVMHMFNHQTHHRGQVHAMLTALGHDPGVTDLAFMPGES